MRCLSHFVVCECLSVRLCLCVSALLSLYASVVLV